MDRPHPDDPRGDDDFGRGWRPRWSRRPRGAMVTWRVGRWRLQALRRAPYGFASGRLAEGTEVPTVSPYWTWIPRWGEVIRPTACRGLGSRFRLSPIYFASGFRR